MYLRLVTGENEAPPGPRPRNIQCWRRFQLPRESREAGPFRRSLYRNRARKTKLDLFSLRQAECLAAETAQVDNQTELEKLTAEQQQPNNRQLAAAFYVSMPI
jgi:hypothetical protein